MGRKFSVCGIKPLHLSISVTFVIAAGTPLYQPHHAAEESANKATAIQIAKPWTAVGSTGAVDELSLPAFAASGATLGFAGASSATSVVARYNVTNTFDNNAIPTQPGWMTMELTSFAPAGTSVSAKLVKVHRCDGVVTSICTASNVGGGGPSCSFCKIAPATIDFSNDLYYVEVTLTRAGAAMPLVHSLRIF